MILRPAVLLASAALFTLFTSMAADPPAQPSPGRALFTEKCARCHGEDGTKGKWGAKNLRVSTLADAAILRQIRAGKGIMPAFAKKLSDEEIGQVVRYVKELRDVR